MAMTLETSGGAGLDPIVARVLERFASDAGLPAPETERLVAAVGHAVDHARSGGTERRVRVAFAWAGDRIDIEIEGHGTRTGRPLAAATGLVDEVLVERGTNGTRVRLSQRIPEEDP